MSNNKYMEYMEERFRPDSDVQPWGYEVTASLALIKELQTLNETLVSLTELDKNDDPHLSVMVREGNEL